MRNIHHNFQKKASIFVCVVLSLLCDFSFSFAQEGIPDPPSLPRLFVNLSKQLPNFLNQNEAAQLEKELENFEKETSNEIVVVIVDDFQGYERADFAIKLGEKWKVGKEKEDNGIIILIKPTKTDGKRTSFIATGRGLEGAIPDLTCKEIVERELNPLLKQNKNYDGIIASLSVLKKLSKGEFSHKDYNKEKESPWWVMPLVFIFLIAAAFYISKRGGGGIMGTSGFFFGRGFGGGSSGGGGGFGGFGGGSFGGGGAGGDW